MTEAPLFQIVARMLLREFDPEGLWRVVHVEAPHLVWLAPVLAGGWPHPRELPSLVDQLEAGRLAIESADPFRANAVAALRQDRRHAERDARRWEAIEPLVSGMNLARLLRPDHRGILLRARADEFGLTYQNMVLMVRRYWARGMTPAAIASDFSACGAKGRHRTLETGKPGPKRVRLDEAGVAVPLPYVVRTEEVCRRFLHGAHLVLGKHRTYGQAWREILKLWWSDLAFDDDGSIVGGLGTYPTLKQFSFFVVTRFPEVERRRRRLGQKKFDLTSRALPGKADGDTAGPGSRFEIDATIADTYLVSCFDRSRIVGRPTVYFVVDVWSRMIVGFYAGFEAPSWVGAISALVNAVTPKVPFCKAYGREIEEWEWPSHHLPAKLMGDRGEMIGLQSGRNLITNLHVQVENAPPGRGDAKGVIERRFGSVPAIYKPFVPGYVKPDFGERGAEDYRKNAKLNLREFYKILIEAVLYHNSHAPAGRVSMPGMVADELVPSPLNYWEWGIVNRSGKLKEWDVDTVALNLLPKAKARLTARGVRFADADYSSPALEATDRLASARFDTVPCEVSYDPRDTRYVYLLADGLPDNFARLERKTPGLERGASLAELQENAERSKQLVQAAERKGIEAGIKTEMRIQQVIESAAAATDAARQGKRPTSKDLAGIRDNKRAEKTLMRPLEAIRIGPPTAPAPERTFAADDVPDGGARPPVDGPRFETTAERLLRQQRERDEDDV